MCRSRQLFLALTLAFGAAACDEKPSSIAGPTPDLEPTGRTPAGGLILLHGVAYDQLVNVNATQISSLKRVNPGNPDASYIVDEIEDRPGVVGRRMPFNGPPFMTDGQILILKRWIELGAPRHQFSRRTP